MGGVDETVRLQLRLDRDGLDDDTADRLTRSLRRAVEEAGLTGVEVRPERAEAPAGARGDGLTLGVLALAFAPVFADHLIQLVREWCGRPGAKPVRFILSVDGREVSGEFDAARMTDDEARAMLDRMRVALRT